MKKAFLLALSALLYFAAAAQGNFNYQPITDDSISNARISAIIKERFLTDSANADGDYKKDYREIYSQRFHYISNMFTEKEIIANRQITEYINSIAAAIIQANPELKNLTPQILVSRNFWPNAYSLGEGTIVLNIGLFARLENEAQLAFVLCHELSHLYLNHTQKNIDRYITTIHSKEFRDELKKIQRSEYQQKRQAEQLAKGIAFSSRSHSREHETDADAKALQLMKATSFDVNQIITCLQLLDRIDDDNNTAGLHLEKKFNFQSFPFQPKWIEKEKSFFAATVTDEKTKKETDSLKTHPDCSKRISILSPKIAALNAKDQQLFVVNKLLFHELKNTFAFEIIEHCYQSKNISRALFYAIQLSDIYTSDIYLQAMIGKCLNSLYTSQKNHELNRVADLPGPSCSAQYNELLRMIQNIRLNDFAALSYYYLQQFEEQGKENEEFLFALINSKANYNKPDEKTKWNIYYIEHFNKRIYQF